MNGRSSLILILFLLLMLLPAVDVTAQDEEISEEEELAALLSLLEEETEIATKTRMNSDFVPGIVTVLRGDQLEALGANTVFEALALVPGVQTALDVTGNPSLVVRGIDFPFNTGNVKVMVDGVSLSRETAGINGAVLFLPIDQVERIEVIRGPGSVVYGEFAFMGLVNIVTRQDESKVFGRADSDEGWTGGAVISHGDPDAFRFTINVARSEDGDAAIPIPRRADAERTYGVATMGWGDFSMIAELVDSTLEITSRPPMSPSIHEAWAVEGHWKREIVTDLELDGWVMAFDDRIAAGASSFEDDGYRAGIDLQWNGWADQSWLAGIEYHSSDINRATLRLPPQPGGPPPPGTTIENVERESFSIVLQDQIDFGDRFSVTAGARYDDYDDIGSRTTPRLSVVWRMTDNHILKAQYAEGFRAPTFFELYNRGILNPDLTFEINETIELNYVYRRPNAVGRATVFRSEIVDMIFVSPTGPGFSNNNSALADGMELEWDQQFTPSIHLIAGVSYVDARDDRVNPPIPFRQDSESAAPWMLDLALLTTPWSDTSLAAHWNWIDDRNGPEEARSFGTIDLTATRDNFFRDDLTFRIGVDNLFDEEIIYVQPRPIGAIAIEYDERAVWAELVWEW